MAEPQQSLLQMIHRSFIIACLLTGATLPSGAQTQLPSAEEIFKLLGNPTARRAWTNAPASASPSHRTLLSSSYSIEGSKAFQVRVAITEGAGYWVNEWREEVRTTFPAKYERFLAKVKTGTTSLSERDYQTVLPRLFKFGDVGWGVAGPLAVGPGGEAYAFSVALPRHQRDVSIVLDTSRGTLSELSEADAQWLGGLQTDFAQRFLPVAADLIARIVGESVQGKEEPWGTAPSSEKSKEASRAEPKSEKAMPVSTPPPASNSNDKSWLLYLGLIAGAIVAWIFLRARFR